MIQWLPMGSQQEWRPSWHTPIAASFLQEVVHHTPRIQEQTTLSDRIELARYLDWQDAERFFNVWPTDYKEAMHVLSSVGLSEGPDNTLHISEAWEQKPLPWEFMDVPFYLPKNADPYIQDLADRAAADSWNGYQKVQKDLRQPFASDAVPPLILKPAIDQALQLVKETKCNTLFIPGMSESEVWVLDGKGLAVVGMSIGFSPGLQEMMKQGKVQEWDKRTPLERGKFYVTQGDVTDGIPLSDESAVVMGSYILHHIPFDRQVSVITDSARVAPHNTAFVYNEDSDSIGMTKWTVYLNTAVTAWDAIMSQVRGVLTVRNLERQKDDIFKQNGIRLQFSEYPGFSDTVRKSKFARWIMPVTNTLITGRG